MATKDRKTTPIPVALDDELLGEVDRVAKAVGESRSAVMRMAIRGGLSWVESSHTDKRTPQEIAAEYASFPHPKVERLEKRIDALIDDLNKLEHRLYAKAAAEAEKSSAKSGDASVKKSRKRKGK